MALPACGVLALISEQVIPTQLLHLASFDFAARHVGGV